MGLEEVRGNAYCLGKQMIPEFLDDALCIIAGNHWVKEQERKALLEAQLTDSPRNLYLDDILF